MWENVINIFKLFEMICMTNRLLLVFHVPQYFGDGKIKVWQGFSCSSRSSSVHIWMLLVFLHVSNINAELYVLSLNWCICPQGTLSQKPLANLSTLLIFIVVVVVAAAATVVDSGNADDDDCWWRLKVNCEMCSANAYICWDEIRFHAKQNLLFKNILNSIESLSLITWMSKLVCITLCTFSYFAYESLRVDDFAICFFFRKAAAAPKSQ